MYWCNIFDDKTLNAIGKCYKKSNEIDVGACLFGSDTLNFEFLQQYTDVPSILTYTPCRKIKRTKIQPTSSSSMPTLWSSSLSKCNDKELTLKELFNIQPLDVLSFCDAIDAYTIIHLARQVSVCDFNKLLPEQIRYSDRNVNSSSPNDMINDLFNSIKEFHFDKILSICDTNLPHFYRLSEIIDYDESKLFSTDLKSLCDSYVFQKSYKGGVRLCVYRTSNNIIHVYNKHGTRVTITDTSMKAALFGEVKMSCCAEFVLIKNKESPHDRYNCILLDIFSLNCKNLLTLSYIRRLEIAEKLGFNIFEIIDTDRLSRMHDCTTNDTISDLDYNGIVVRSSGVSLHESIIRIKFERQRFRVVGTNGLDCILQTTPQINKLNTRDIFNETFVRNYHLTSIPLQSDARTKMNVVCYWNRSGVMKFAITKKGVFVHLFQIKNTVYSDIRFNTCKILIDGQAYCWQVFTLGFVETKPPYATLVSAVPRIGLTLLDCVDFYSLYNCVSQTDYCRNDEYP